MTLNLLLVCSAFVPFLLGAALTIAARRWALRTGFLDVPAGRKAHDQAIPMGGGVAIFLTVALCAGVALVLAAVLQRWGVPAWFPATLAIHLDGVVDKGPTLMAVIGGAAVLHAVGLIDDRRAIGALPKLTAQVLVAFCLTTFFGIRAVEMFGTPVAIAVSTLWIVAITNAFNFLDNMDGLSAGIAVIAGLLFALAARLAGQIFVPALTLILVGAVAGFWVFNFPPARIFMGDAGSLVIGYMLAVLTILTTFHDPGRSATPLGVLVPPVVLAVPLYDFLSVIWIRRRQGVSIFKGDHRHFSHRLAQRGFSKRATVLTIYLATLSTGLPALLLPNSTWWRSIVILAQCLCVVALVALLEQGGAPRDRRG